VGEERANMAASKRSFSKALTRTAIGTRTLAVTIITNSLAGKTVVIKLTGTGN